MVRDKDAHAYGCALTCCCLTSTQDASVHFYEFTEHEDLLAGLRLQSEDDVRALVWFFGVNDQPAPAELLIEATAPWATKDKADDASGRGDRSEVMKTKSLTMNQSSSHEHPCQWAAALALHAGHPRQ